MQTCFNFQLIVHIKILITKHSQVKLSHICSAIEWSLKHLISQFHLSPNLMQVIYVFITLFECDMKEVFETINGFFQSMKCNYLAINFCYFSLLLLINYSK